MARTPTEKELQYRNRTPKINKKCLSCGEYFVRPPSQAGKYCSFKCYWSDKKGKEITEKVKIRCFQCGEEFKTWNCRIRVGKKYCSKKCHNLSQLNKAPWNKGVESKIKGSKHYNWQGGKTAKSTAIIHSFEYREFRQRIFKRDNFTCILCGDKTGGNLQVDHIKPRSLFPELIFNDNNVRTLCENCHKNTPTYLNSQMRREEFIYGD